MLHYRAATASIDWHGPSTFPMGALPQTRLEQARSVLLEPGDVLGLISDGIYEYENAAGEHFGEDRVADVVCGGHERPMKELVAELLARAREFGDGAAQADDVTIVLIRRLTAPPA